MFLITINSDFCPSSPIPKLKWYKIGAVTSSEKEIQAGGDFRLTRFNQFLTIRDVDDSKAGNYKCEAKNSEGTDSTTGKITVAGKYLALS